MAGTGSRSGYGSAYSTLNSIFYAISSTSSTRACVPFAFDGTGSTFALGALGAYFGASSSAFGSADLVKMRELLLVPLLPDLLMDLLHNQLVQLDRLDKYKLVPPELPLP